MKKVLGFIGVLVGIYLFYVFFLYPNDDSAVQNNDTQPVQSQPTQSQSYIDLTEALNAIQNCDKVSIYNFWSNSFNSDVVKVMTSDSDTVKQIQSGMTYSIMDIQENYNTAVATVSIKNKNYGDYLLDEDYLYYDGYITGLDDSYYNRASVQSEEASLGDVENTTRIIMYKIDGHWYGDATYEFLNAVNGGMVDALDKCQVFMPGMYSSSGNDVSAESYLCNIE